LEVRFGYSIINEISGDPRYHIRAGLLLGFKSNSLYKVVSPSLTRKPEWRKDVVVDKRDEPDDMLKRGAEDTLQST
jgi:hypothetical protein